MVIANFAAPYSYFYWDFAGAQPLLSQNEQYHLRRAGTNREEDLRDLDPRLLPTVLFQSFDRLIRLVRSTEPDWQSLFLKHEDPADCQSRLYLQRGKWHSPCDLIILVGLQHLNR